MGTPEVLVLVVGGGGLVVTSATTLTLLLSAECNICCTTTGTGTTVVEQVVLQLVVVVAVVVAVVDMLQGRPTMSVADVDDTTAICDAVTLSSGMGMPEATIIMNCINIYQIIGFDTLLP